MGEASVESKFGSSENCNELILFYSDVLGRESEGPVWIAVAIASSKGWGIVSEDWSVKHQVEKQVKAVRWVEAQNSWSGSEREFLSAQSVLGLCVTEPCEWLCRVNQMVLWSVLLAVLDCFPLDQIYSPVLRIGCGCLEDFWYALARLSVWLHLTGVPLAPSKITFWSEPKCSEWGWPGKLLQKPLFECRCLCWCVLGMLTYVWGGK